jgi:CMP-N-acetylneuraminic acid synthetase
MINKKKDNANLPKSFPKVLKTRPAIYFKDDFIFSTDELIKAHVAYFKMKEKLNDE